MSSDRVSVGEEENTDLRWMKTAARNGKTWQVYSCCFFGEKKKMLSAYTRMSSDRISVGEEGEGHSI